MGLRCGRVYLNGFALREARVYLNGFALRDAGVCLNVFALREAGEFVVQVLRTRLLVLLIVAV